MKAEPRAPELFLKLRIKRVMFLLLANCGQRPVSGTNDRIVGQAENLLAIGAQRFFVGNCASAHRRGKKYVTHHGQMARQTGYGVGDFAAGMSAGLARDSRLCGGDFHSVQNRQTQRQGGFKVWLQPAQIPKNPCVINRSEKQK